ncbi:PREDICTED: uncharacterized protein LOC104820715 [Tarenaya hassleriana]|uniref:uncharacterized protein LOC104820715 n=1 Tax=Tarenaya hassleriana TaxID=28532 RepID=UPI00053C5E36|nr:PREDICTED: uncharacterized protein LOC104820715 [Tarenaya hassleriana]
MAKKRNHKPTAPSPKHSPPPQIDHDAPPSPSTTTKIQPNLAVASPNKENSEQIHPHPSSADAAAVVSVSLPNVAAEIASDASPFHADDFPPLPGTSSSSGERKSAARLAPAPPSVAVARPSAQSKSAPKSCSAGPSSVDTQSTPSLNFPWANRLRKSSRNLSRLVTPTYTENGTPRIKVPSSVFREASKAWTGYLVGQFYGISPNPSKIFQALNPIWGRKSRITVRRISDSACLFFIPDLATREWALEVGLWRVADVMFALTEWNPTSTLRKPTLKSAPVWVTLRNIPPEMFSLQGISYIASGLGEPLHTERMRLDPMTIGEAKVKVEIQLGAPLPAKVEVEDDVGEVSTIEVIYAWIPPRCDGCKEFGHKLHACPFKSAPSAISEQAEDTHQAPSASAALGHQTTDPKFVGQGASTTPASQPTPTKPSPENPSPPPPIPSQNQTPPSNLTPPPTQKPPTPNQPDLPHEPLSTADARPTQKARFSFDSEDLLVAEAQRILRSRSTVINLSQQPSMKIFCWNVRGLNGTCKQRNVKNWIESHRPLIGGIVETRIREELEARRVAQSLFPGWSIISNYSSAILGRILIAWDPALSVVVYSSTAQIITCGVYELSSGRYVTISFVYGRNTSIERRELWDEISQIACNSLVEHNPWLLLGDFNQILQPADHFSDKYPFNPHSGMYDFQNCLGTSGLFDLNGRGEHFTWSNNNSDSLILRKLDRAIVNEKWLLSFPDSFALYEPPAPSDHCPCIVSIPPNSQLMRRSSFKFLHCLMQHPDFTSIVRREWPNGDTQGSCMFRLVTKLKYLKGHLRALKRSSYNNLQQRTEEALDNLKAAQAALFLNPSHEAVHLEADLRASWSSLASAEESFLRQKSRIRWLKEGDQNTRFFHRVSVARQASNAIRFLVTDAGTKVYDVPTMKQMAVDHFKQILGSCDESLVGWSIQQAKEILDYRCPELMGCLLTAIPSDEDIKAEVFNLPKSKAPGPDEYSAEFFTSCWETIGADLIAAIQEFFCSGKLLRQWNATLITLIPKSRKADQLKDFRPIACCNTIYKIISRILSRRLKLLMDQAITPNQSAFIPGRSITENILLATELISDFSRRGRPKMGIIKADISKAFDTVQWDFVLTILQAMEIPPRFISWIGECISTAMYSISFNGEITGFFQGKRGLRQGDPLSPYLFVLVMNVLSKFLDTAATEGRLTLPPHCRTPLISHLCFADDVLVFSDSSSRSLSTILRTFDEFYRLSGLKLNKVKTCLFLDGDECHTKADIAESLGISLSSLPVRYLGLPLTATKLGEADCSRLKEAIKSRLSSWTVRHLSFAGRLQLIKSVIYSVITYWASAFIIPGRCAKDIERMCSAFLWKGVIGSARGAKVSWSSICLPKKHGGLGLKKITDWNRILCLKMIWNLFAKAGSLWVAWTQAHRIKGRPFWTLRRNGKGSWAWRRLLKIRPLAYPFLRCQVGNGRSCSFWFDSWLPSGPLINVLCELGPRQLGIPRNATVNRAVDGEGWLLPPARSPQAVQIHCELLNHPVPHPDNNDDVFYWADKHCSDRLPIFSTSKAWKLHQILPPPVTWHKSVWFPRSIPKHSFIVWLAAKNRLPTKDRLLSWGLDVADTCVLCDSSVESVDHLFFCCQYTHVVWSAILAPAVIQPPSLMTFEDQLQWLSSWPGTGLLKLMVSLLFQRQTTFSVVSKRGPYEAADRKDNLCVALAAANRLSPNHQPAHCWLAPPVIQEPFPVMARNRQSKPSSPSPPEKTPVGTPSANPSPPLEIPPSLPREEPQPPSSFLPSDFPPLPTASARASPLIETSSPKPPPPNAAQAPPPASPSASCQDLQFPWAQRLRQSSRNLSRMGKPSISPEGIPRIRVPSSVFQEASKAWASYLVGQFYGVVPNSSIWAGNLVSPSGAPVTRRVSSSFLILLLGNGP